MFGRQPNLRGALGENAPMFRENADATAVDVNTARNIAVERTKAKQLKQKERYDKHRRTTDVNEGDLVTIEVQTLKIGQSPVQRATPRAFLSNKGVAE